MRAVAVLLLTAACTWGIGCGSTQETPPTLYIVPLDAEVPGEADESPVAWVEIAATPAARERGLMGREGLDKDTGMLFIYPEERRLSFWMMNTKIPLTICYFRDSGEIVTIRHMAPGDGIPAADQRNYPSAGPTRFALEMEQGWFTAMGISRHSRVRLHPSIIEIRPR